MVIKRFFYWKCLDQEEKKNTLKAIEVSAANNNLTLGYEYEEDDPLVINSWTEGEESDHRNYVKDLKDGLGKLKVII